MDAEPGPLLPVYCRGAVGESYVTSGRVVSERSEPVNNVSPQKDESVPGICRGHGVQVMNGRCSPVEGASNCRQVGFMVYGLSFNYL